MSDEDRTHDATPARREQFRKEGRFARSRDAAGIVAAAAVLAVIAGSRGALTQSIGHLTQHTFGDLDAISRGDATPLRAAVMTLGALVIPAGIAASVGGLLVGFAQAGIRVDMELLAPKPERLNPFTKLQEILSPKHAATELLGSGLRVVLAGFVGYRVLLLELPRVMRLADLPLAAGAPELAAVAVRVLLAVLFALALIAGGDYLQHRLSLEKQMKMTRKELMDEMRQQDGDPKLKARQKARARAMAKQRAMNNVKDASVVVTNPTHVSVALRYGAKDRAPVVVAKGHDDLALQIRRIARKHGIPILESRALARALDAEVPIGKPVPEQHFLAVARILAFVYGLRGARPGSARDVRSKRA